MLVSPFLYWHLHHILDIYIFFKILMFFYEHWNLIYIVAYTL